jgi:Tol biopolymer transport system component
MSKFLSLLIFIPFFALAQKGNKTNVFTNAGDAGKMALAKQRLYAGDYVGALNTYREVEKNNPDNGSVNYYLGFCYFHLRQMDNAKASLLKAVENKDALPESRLMLGRVYQVEQDFDKAIPYLESYTATAGADAESLAEGKLVLSQCKTAKNLMAKPLPVQINNLGSDINSKYDDKNPCITADGSKLVFTTRRPETTNSEVDIEGDGKYFEEIFISNRDSLTKNFGKAGPVSSAINIKAHDAVTSISADGKQIFIYYNDLKNKARHGGNIFVSKVTNGKWKAPENLGKPINSSYWEGGVCVSPDGKRYFFTSERPGGYGHSDIWMVEHKGKTEWGQPVNLGPEINTANDEGGMFLAPDGKTLFFCSNSAASMGGYDIFRTVFENGKWSTPENLGYPINTPAHEGQITISADAKYAYFSSDRKGGLGENDIYKITLSTYDILEKDGKRKNGNGLGILKGTIREGGEGYGIAEVEVIVTDLQGQVIGSTYTSDIGEYFLTLSAGNYKIELRKKGYESIQDQVEIPLNERETPQVEKGYLFKKQQ